MNGQHLPQNVYDLGGDHQKLKELYGGWAAEYDRDVQAEGYLGPMLIAQLAHMARPGPGARVIDAGCGTGLVGRALQSLNAELQLSITGLDLVPEMAEQAAASGAYTRALGDFDLSDPESAELAEVEPAELVTCCGTITQGHIGPKGLETLLRLTAPGGRAVVSIKRSYSVEHGFAEAVRRLEESGRTETISELYNAPYIAYDGADYFVLQRRQ